MDKKYPSKKITEKSKGMVHVAKTVVLVPILQGFKAKITVKKPQCSPFLTSIPLNSHFIFFFCLQSDPHSPDYPLACLP